MSSESQEDSYTAAGEIPFAEYEEVIPFAGRPPSWHSRTETLDYEAAHIHQTVAGMADSAHDLLRDVSEYISALDAPYARMNLSKIDIVKRTIGHICIAYQCAYESEVRARRASPVWIAESEERRNLTYRITTLEQMLAFQADQAERALKARQSDEHNLRAMLKRVKLKGIRKRVIAFGCALLISIIWLCVSYFSLPAAFSVSREVILWSSISLSAVLGILLYPLMEDLRARSRDEW